MKFFAILFSFYILGLSAMPCADYGDCKYQGEKVTFISSDHSNHDQDTENCPPFCICNCCGQICNVSFLKYSISINSIPAVQDFSIYTSAFIPEVYFSIWQPPKIS